MGNADTLWAKVFGPTNQLANSSSAAIDGVGNVIVGGDFLAVIDLGGGMLSNTGAFVAKYGPSGAYLWDAAFGTMGSMSNVAAVVVDGSGAVYAMGSFSGTINCGGGPLTDPGSANQAMFVAKLDPSGNHVWSKLFGDGTNQVQPVSMALAPSGVVIVGSYTTSLAFGGTTLTATGGAGEFVVALDTGGNPVWAKSLPSLGSIAAAVDGAGNVAIAGTSTSSVDLGGGPIMNVGGADIVVAKLGAAGNFVWGKGFGSGADDGASAVAFDAAGDVVVAGFASGAISFGGGTLGAGSVLAKLDGTGAHLWSMGFQGNAQFYGLAADATGVFLAGVASGTVGIGGTQLPASGSSLDFLVAKLDPTGAYVWGRRASGGRTASAQQISLNASHDSAVAASVRGPVDFGTGSLPCTGVCAAVVSLGP